MSVSVGICKILLISVFLCFSLRSMVSGRAILVEPPHRSSLWRFNYNTTVNYKDDNLNCGGYDWQWGVNNGRCGVCGDIYNGSQDNDDNGKFSSGIIVRRYKDGHYINITFEVSSNYLGYVEFRLCPRNSTQQKLNQSCFDRYPLWIDESHSTRYYIGSRGGVYDVHVRLPGGLVCKKCVLQWKYKTGYRYNGAGGCQCLGCGKQEQYINCADIEVYPVDDWAPETNKSISAMRSTTKSTATSVSGNIISSFINPSTIAVEQSRMSLLSSRVAQLFTSFDTSRHSTDTNKSVEPSTGSTLGLAPSYRSPGSETTVAATMATPIIRTGIDVITTSRISTEASQTIMGGQTASATIAATKTKRNEKSKIPSVRKPEVAPGPSGRQPDKVVPETTTMENTQFVSVSNIMHRFYPNYIPPYMFPPMLLPNPIRARTTKRRVPSAVPSGCDVNSDDFRCVARGIYNNSPGVSRWCEINCRASHCVPFMCECSCEDRTKLKKSKCHAISEFTGVDGMDQWCAANCKLGYCPPNTCSVEDCKSDTNTNGEA